MSRTDDVIKVAGHRISTGRIDEAIASHPDVAELAVVGMNHDIKGETPLAFIVLKGLIEVSKYPQAELDRLSKEIGDRVSNDIGKFAKLEGVIFIDRLPKTRSGKIIRAIIKKILNKEDYIFPATIDDPITLTMVEDARD